MKRVWTLQMIDTIIRDYPTADLRTLAHQIGVSYSALKSKAKVLHLQRNPNPFWSQKKTKELIALYPSLTNKKLGEIFQVSEKSISAIAFKLRLFKSKEFHRESASKTWFRKGDNSFNKGKKWDEFMSPDGQKNSIKTTFKKGSKPMNHKPVGSQRIENRDGYLLVKTEEPNVWKLKHRLVWEQHNGKIPRGFNVQFLNKDRSDCRIENLYLISRSDQVGHNSIIRYPNELRKAIFRVSKIKKLIKQNENNN